MTVQADLNLYELDEVIVTSHTESGGLSDGECENQPSTGAAIPPNGDDAQNRVSGGPCRPPNRRGFLDREGDGDAGA